ncbi:MAG: succinylglutamate desuccinylase/aspartoacylase family protein [Atribacterota bacterium]|nr:succinylglutamate desuccinylase/aspartoacylase family protein [Atribacterota bacterium]
MFSLLIIHVLYLQGITEDKLLINRQEIILCEGTDYQTNAYLFSSQQSEPAIMIIAGAHGDEIAGIEAAKKILDNFKLEKGTVIFIPEANKLAVDNHVRAITPDEDLNRHYPGDVTQEGVIRLAGEIFSVMEENNVIFLLDLHESTDYYQNNETSFGQTIVIDDMDHTFLLEISHLLAESLNESIVLPQNLFQVIEAPIEGSSTYESLRKYNIPGITFETCTLINLKKRIKLHSYCIQYILDYFDIIQNQEVEIIY